jgi:hypothetical protein
MEILNENEKLIAQEDNIRAGSVIPGGVRKAYNLYLAKNSTSNYILIVFMKVQFFFRNGVDTKWTDSEKNIYVQQWKSSICSAWGNNRVIKTLADGKTVTVDFRFKTQIGGFMLDHWEITVTKIPAGQFLQSYIQPKIKNVTLDSEDISLTQKGFNQKQRGAVHEFGHMLGLEDEYQDTSNYSTQYSSVMNRGEMINLRHDTFYLQWLDKVLNKKNQS